MKEALDALPPVPRDEDGGEEAEAAAALGTTPAHVTAGIAAAAAPAGQVQMGAGAVPQNLAEMGQMLGNIWEVVRQPRRLHCE